MTATELPKTRKAMKEAREREAITESTAKETPWAIFKGFLNGLLIGVTIIAAGVVLAAIVIPRLMGAIPLTVLTGSMVPTFNPGDLIITMPVEPENVEAGDIVTFQPESGVATLVTHRIVSIGFSLDGETVFVTKGDANSASDDPIIGDQIMGEYIYHIPYLGWLANAIPATNKPYVMQILGIGFIAWAVIQLVLIPFAKDKRAKKKLAKAEELKTDTSDESAEIIDSQNEVEASNASPSLAPRKE